MHFSWLLTLNHKRASSHAESVNSENAFYYFENRSVCFESQKLM